MIFTLLAIDNQAAQVEHERHCNCMIGSALKSFCFSSIFFHSKNILTEPWIENISIVFFNLVELIPFVCVKNIIYRTNTCSLFRLSAMLSLYEHYIIAGVLSTRPNASRKMMFVSFWSECFVTGGAREQGNDSSIHRFQHFRAQDPLVCFNIVPLKETWCRLSLVFIRYGEIIVKFLWFETRVRNSDGLNKRLSLFFGSALLETDWNPLSTPRSTFLRPRPSRFF